MKQGDIVYYAKEAGSVAPLGPVAGRKSTKKKIALLWGDPLYLMKLEAGKATVSAKGHYLELKPGDLMEERLLSLYQIDCGQGDAALLHLPDDRWLMIDGGPPREMSNSGKIASDFLGWKIFVDQSWRQEFNVGGGFRLDAVVCTHPDADHYGGLVEVAGMAQAGKLTIGTVFHCGLARYSGTATAFANGAGFGQLGPVAGNPLPDAYLTTLLDGFADVKKFGKTQSGRAWKLTGDYGDWLKQLASLQGKGVDKLQRVDYTVGALPGFAPGAPGTASIKVLGPIVEPWNGKPALRYLDGANKSDMASPSLTRNGHSVVLRVDFSQMRLLMTGDLNFRSQALLLSKLPAAEFNCHVAKACHHGSEDISWKFFQAIAPLATLFSSGDCESYTHPRAKALALSAAFGRLRTEGRQSFLGLEEEVYVAPLIYSTELSRSVRLQDVGVVTDANQTPVTGAQIAPRKAGTSQPDLRQIRAANRWLLGDDMVYGLINMRTDGNKVLLAVLKEDSAEFQTETFTVA